MKRTTIFLGEPDRVAIQTIKDRYGVSSDSDAIRLALRVMAGIQNPPLLLLPLSEPLLNETSERMLGDVQKL